METGEALFVGRGEPGQFAGQQNRVPRYQNVTRPEVFWAGTFFSATEYGNGIQFAEEAHGGVVGVILPSDRNLDADFTSLEQLSTTSIRR